MSRPRTRYERSRSITRRQMRASLAVPAPARDSSGTDLITQAINDAFAAEFGVTRRPQLALVAGGQS
jgi:hypothetical protein